MSQQEMPLQTQQDRARAQKNSDAFWDFFLPTASLVLSSGYVLKGWGIGARKTVYGELCFNTAITGYQEVLTDLSYSGQIITFTFPHIGNTGGNEEDNETAFLEPAVKGAQGGVFHALPTHASSYRALKSFDKWLQEKDIVGICGIDTRALTAHIRTNGMPMAAIAPHDATFSLEEIKRAVGALPAPEGQELALSVTSPAPYVWKETGWIWREGYRQQGEKTPKTIVVIDFGIKKNILCCLAETGCRIVVVPAKASLEQILSYAPDGIFLSNGPGDPEATGAYIIPPLKKLIEMKIPIFGICLGHQILALALEGKTHHMRQGHHGSNHPVRNLETGKIEITAMNHGFCVDTETLPGHVIPTHISLFDGSNCGLRVKDAPVFSVQYHPESSPGPHDSRYLFEKFTDMVMNGG